MAQNPTIVCFYVLIAWKYRMTGSVPCIAQDADLLITSLISNKDVEDQLGPGAEIQPLTFLALTFAIC